MYSAGKFARPEAAWEPKSVVVFGASRGIGWWVADRYQSQGHRVVATHRGSGVPAGCLSVEADLTNPDDIERAVALALDRHGCIEVAVVGPAITRDNVLLRQTAAEMDEVFDVNFHGPVRVAKSLLRPMLRTGGGSVVMVGALSGRVGAAGQTNYTASKAALEGFVRSAAREYARKNIRFNIVAPGPTETDMLAAVPQREFDAMIAQVPMGRPAKPHEIADVVYWVGLSTFMTGATVPVGGGAGIGL